MICARCLRRASAALTPTTLPLRSARHALSSTAPARAQQAVSPSTTQTSQPQRSPPAATSTAAAQPLSTRDTPSPQASAAATEPPPAPARPQSSVPAGTPLKGLNYFKNRDDPIALEDAAYPAWLWDVLAPKKQAAGGGAGETDPRIYSKSANARRKANRRAREQAALLTQQERSVPVYEQSVDLQGTPDARLELSRAMRDKRRRDIKEANFLRAMR